MSNDLIFPKYLSIQTTSLCNASCVFCPYKDIKDLFPHKIMDMALYKKIIDECSNYKSVERIIPYMNNEPLTDPYLIERINYAKEKVPRASVHILTNGLLLTEEMSGKLISSKLDWIGISLHGIRKETIDKTMGIPYEIALKRINNFVEKASQRKNIKDYILVTFLRHKYLSREEKDETLRFWKKKGVERISYFEGPISRAGNVKNLPKVYRKEEIVGCNSIWADEMIHIVEDGKVILCCMDWRREVILGDLNKQSIYGVWNGRRKEIWQVIYGKSDMPKGFLCRRCEGAKVDTKENIARKENNDLILVMTPAWQTKMVPLGLAYLSSFLSSQGIKLKVLDLNVELFNNCDDKEKYLWNISTINNFTPGQIAQNFVQAFSKELKDFVEILCSSSAKLIGFSTTVGSINMAVYLAHQIKAKDPSKIIILGGPGCFWGASEIDPEKLVDVFVVGEGELPLLEIVKRFKSKECLSDLLGIQGTIICMDKTYYSFLPPNPVQHIDNIPFPTFSEFDLDKYNKGSMYKPLPMLISRGCINNCSFCVDHKMNYPFRLRNPYKVIEEIKFHLNQHGKTEFELNDLLCNGNLRQLEEICDLIISENIDIKWSSYAVIRTGMSLGLFKKMREAGCRYICYGMESASDVVLRKMNKRYISQIAEEVVRNTHTAGIETGVNIIIGHPGESEKEFNGTYKFVQRNKEYIDQITNVSTCFLIPESDLIKNHAKYGIYFKPSLKQRLSCIFSKKDLMPDHRRFYTYPDNTPSARARRTRRLLVLLNKLNIPFVIVNYQKEFDKNLNKFLEKIGKNINILKYKYLKLDFSQKGKCKLYFRNKELTSDVGMNTSFNINKKWYDSSSARWKIKSFGKTLDININWLGLPVTQHWILELKNKSVIDWKVITFFNDRTGVFQYKIGMMVSDQYNKYTVKDRTRDCSNLFTDNWEEALFLNMDRIELSADSFLPSIVLRGKFNKEIFTQIHNTPRSLRTRMLNFCLLPNNNPNDYNNEGRRFNKGDILKGRVKINVR